VQLFVGNRPIRDRGLLHAIAMGYGELVPRGRYPVAVVLVDAPAGSVDINVHPQKLEVRFADPAAACAAVRHVVAAAVAKAAWRSDSAQPLQMMAIASVAPPALPFDAPATPMAERYAAQLSSLRGDSQRSFDIAPRTSEPGVRDWVHRVKSTVRAAEYRARAEPRPPELAIPAWPAGTMPGRAVEATGFFTTLRYLGQLDLTYLVCEAAGEMVLVDQHAAHERVELARLREAGRDVSIQRMLFPVTIEASPAQVELVGTVVDVLAQVGYEAEAFGKTTIAVKAVPAGIRHGDPAQLLRRLLDTWIDDNHASSVERLERVLAEIACHSVVRAGDRLSAGEAEALLRSLDASDLTANPHGRPMLLRIPIGEIARRFGR
jgi:DNA mismatch repair protein MutL